MALPSGTMHKVIATFAQLHEAHRERAAVLLDDMKRRYLPEGDAKIADAHL